MCQNARKIDALDQWCLRMLLGIKWYQFVRNDDVRRLTKQPKLTDIIQSRRLTLFGHIMRMDDNNFGDRCFAAAGPRLSNTLPLNLRLCDSLGQFKRSLKTFLFGL